MRFKFTDGPVQPYARIGTTANILFWQRTNLFVSGEGVSKSFEVGDIDGMKKFHLSVNGAIGVNWNFTKRFGMYVEGQFDNPVSKFVYGGEHFGELNTS